MLRCKCKSTIFKIMYDTGVCQGLECLNCKEYYIVVKSIWREVMGW